MARRLPSGGHFDGSAMQCNGIDFEGCLRGQLESLGLEIELALV
ncbi:unnamed protein product [Acidithrix sp. C25]|nr:unnamed protein product [Acidithrix sp. C25]